ncbi:MAG: hypothetical protein GY694_04455 [Gammaproteobacteria bacterium]|nr:hypothetical protein [Gammaproteobacteria bacterium]
MDDRNILYLVNKKPFPNSWPDEEQYAGGRWMHVQVNNQEQDQEQAGTLYHSKYRWFTKRCKQLLSNKNGNTRFGFAKQHLKRL